MVKLRCQDCGDIIDGKLSDIDELECDCGGSYAKLGSEDDEYEPKICPVCKKEMKDDDTFSCDECYEEICEECIIDFENAGQICRKCIDEAYPSRNETKIEYKEKIIEKPIYVDKEGVPIDNKFNPNNKSRFD